MYFLVDGNFTEWTSWSVCSKTCGLGQVHRSRSCSNPLPQYGGKFCSGNDTESKPCNKGPCCEYHLFCRNMQKRAFLDSLAPCKNFVLGGFDSMYCLCIFDGFFLDYDERDFRQEKYSFLDAASSQTNGVIEQLILKGLGSGYK